MGDRHGYAHHYNGRTVAGAFLAVNSAEYFFSPLNLGKPNRGELTRHGGARKTARQVAQNAVDLFRSINLRNDPNDPPGLEAIGVICVEHDNINMHPELDRYADVRRSTQVSPRPPSLPVGDPMHYRTMIQRLCGQFVQRFG